MNALKISALISVSVLSGCATIMPDANRTGYSHTSHPSAGAPFGPEWEEDTIDQIETSLVWKDVMGAGMNYELGVGYLLRDGGFYGPKLIFNGRVYKEFEFKRRR